MKRPPPRKPKVITLNSRLSDAELCWRNGWRPGLQLAGNEGYGVTVIRLTAIGEEGILAVEESHDGEPMDEYESYWTLHNRDWRPLPAPRKRGRK